MGKSPQSYRNEDPSASRIPDSVFVFLQHVKIKAEPACPPPIPLSYPSPRLAWEG